MARSRNIYDGFRLFKARWTRDGIVKQTANWYIEFNDHRQIKRKMALLANKAASEEMARKILRLVGCQISKQPPTGELAIWLESLPLKMVDRLVKFGILDKQRASAAQGIDSHVADYIQSLENSNCTPRHILNTTGHLEKVIEGCGFKVISDLDANRVLNYLADRRSAGPGITTANHYIRSIKGFSGWLVDCGRTGHNPLANLKKLNARVDVRRKRRGLTGEECALLIAAAENGEPWRGISGHERALIYRFALGSGLRANEIATLTCDCLELDSVPPKVTVAAENSKHKKEDVLPLQGALVELLRDHTALKLPAAPVFTMPKHGAQAKMIRATLKRQGLSMRRRRALPIFTACGIRSFQTLLKAGFIRRWLRRSPVIAI